MVQADSGLSKDTELSSLVEEITRRLRNTSLEVDNNSKMEILEEACTRKKTSYHQDCFIPLLEHCSKPDIAGHVYYWNTGVSQKLQDIKKELQEEPNPPWSSCRPLRQVGGKPPSRHLNSRDFPREVPGVWKMVSEASPL